MWTVDQWNVLRALCDAVVEPLTKEELEKANPESPVQDKIALAGTGAGHGPVFQQAIISIMREVPTNKLRLLSLVLNALSYRVSAAPLTKSHKLITEMTLSERRATIRSWQNSVLPQLRMMASQITNIGMIAFFYGNPHGLAASGFTLDNPVYNRISQQPLFVPKFVESFDSNEQFDVIVIGSGCGGGLAAYEAAKAGFKVLIVEKAKYFAPETISRNPREAEEYSMELGGTLMTDDGSLSIMAGSTVGGGGAVNWSCSLKTPQGIREEWSDDAPWYKTTIYDDALDYVWNAMGVTTDFDAAHSFTNQLILDSSAKLDYPAKVAAQNTGKHPYNNRYHGFGYRSGEKGGIAVWLEGATKHGAILAESTAARQIIRKHGKAIGLELELNGTSTFVKAKRIVSAGGSLHTPLLLQRSGFKNRHIGKHLKLHPVTVVYGDHDEVVNRNDDPIMTTVSTVVDNLDGHHHGPKIEAIHHQPHIMGKFIPWRNGKQYATDLARYSHLSSLLVITRDEGEGQVYLDKSLPMTPRISYSTSKYDLWALLQGCIVSANMQYIGGAKRIIISDKDIPAFHSAKPKDQRRLNDDDYQQWLKHLDKHVFYNFSTPLGSAHQMGSCRISVKGSRHGALDGRGRLYECKNVHVIDASVFPSASGVNPMISTLASAKVLSDELVKSLKADATKL